MNPSSIYSKSGKGVQEASGKTSLLSRADRMVLAAFDGRATLGEVAQKVGKPFDGAFEQVVVKLDKDGFIREVPGSAPAAPAPRPQGKSGASKPAAAAPAGDLDFSAIPPSKPSAPPPPGPSASPGSSSGLDFSTLGTSASKPSAPPAAKPTPKPSAPTPPPAPPHAGADAERRAQEQGSSLAKARQEAEARAQRDRDRAKADADAKLRAEMEAKLRAEAAAKGQADLEARMRAEADAKVKAAREAAVRAAAEAKAKAEAEMKAKLEAERAKLEEERKRIDAERKAREEAERKAKEEAERLRKEAEEKARAEAEALRKQLEAERAKLEEERRKAEEERKRIEEERKEHERRAKEEAERKAKEEAERKAREQAERKAKEQAERKAKEEAERREREEEEAKRAAEEKAAAVSAAAAETAPRMAVPPPRPSEPENFDDKLLADLESFDKHDDEEQRAKEEENERRKRAEESERDARAAADRRAREESERQRAEEQERRRKEEARRAREEEERREQAERDREREAALVAAQRAAAKADDDIGVSDADLDMDDVKQDQRVMAVAAKRETASEAKAEPAASLMRRGPPIKWGKIIGAAVVLALIAGLAWLQFMPLSAVEFEKAASAALGRPVRIGSARLSLFTGLQMTFRDVRVGDDIKIASVRASPDLGTLFGGARKAFGRLDLEGASIPEGALGETLLGKLGGDSFTARRVVAHNLKLAEPLALPPVDADLTFAADGSLKSVTLTGADNLLATLTPKAGELQFDMTAGRFAVPMAPDISLNDFSMKGTASARGAKIDSWDGALFEGRFSGAAEVKWGTTWTAEGPLKVRGVNVAVFAPALISAGKGEGSGRFSMHGPDPEKLGDTLRVEGSFSILKGTLGSVDLARAIETGGRQWSGRTEFNELNGQGVYDKGAVSLRSLTISAGAMSAGASVDVAASGALSGRIIADVKSSTQNLRATVNLGGTAKEPQVRN